MAQSANTANTMNRGITRSISRWVHIIFAIPIAGYIYSPFEELPNYASVVRFVAVPVIVLTGLWMWKGHLLRRLISKRPSLFWFRVWIACGQRLLALEHFSSEIWQLSTTGIHIELSFNERRLFLSSLTAPKGR